MKKRKTIFSQNDIKDLICELKKIYPKLYSTNISNLDQKKYLLESDLLVRSEMFENTLLEFSDIIIGLSSIKQNEFVSGLKSLECQLKTTFHEFVVGDTFKKNNFSLTYQPIYNIQNHNNPDWEVEKNDLKVIIEVFTLNKYEDYRDEQYFTLLLAQRLKVLEEEYNLKLDFNRSGFDINDVMNSHIKDVMNSHINDCISMIINDVKLWLKNNSNRTINNRHETHFGLEIIISDFKLNFKVLKGATRSDRLINKIREKYNDYINLIDIEQKPFIIACISDNLKRLSVDHFNDIIFGLPPTSSSSNKDSVINQQDKLSEVSGFMLFDLNIYTQQIDYKYIPNPNAKYPLELLKYLKGNIRKNINLGRFL